MMSEFQKKKFTHYFYLWDGDKNGYLNYDDFAQLHQRIATMKALTPNSAEYQALQKNTEDIWGGMQQFADTNNDGKVSLDEWLVYCDAALPTFKQMADANAPTPMGEAIFSFMDANGDGEVEVSEWAAFLHAWGITDNPADHFKLMDTNGDGKISNEEFTRLSYVWGYSDDANAPGNFLFGSF